MRLRENSMFLEPPTLIADVDGNVIFANSKASNMLYPIKVGDSIAKYVDLDHVKKISVFEKRIDVMIPKNCEFERVIVKTVGTGIAKTVELMFLHVDEDEDIIDEKRLFASYTDIMSASVTTLVELKRFIEFLVSSMHQDFRFAYRKFGTEEIDEDNKLYTNFSHLCSLAVCTIVTLNEIEYRNPIEIRVTEVLGEYILELSVRKNTFENATGLYDLSLLFPRATMHMVYLSSICEEDGIEYKFSVLPNRITYTFIISDMVNETGKFAFSPLAYDEQSYISYLIDAFMPTNRAAEEQE